MEVGVRAFVPCLLAFLLCHGMAKPRRLSSRSDPSQEGLGSGAGSVPDRTPAPRYACPPRCRCHVTVVQCSNLGLIKVPPYIPSDTAVLDLQNNKIRELTERDFRNLQNLRILILVNNRLRKVHSRALAPLHTLRRLYLSKNLISHVPDNMPNTLVELHLCDNKIKFVKKKPFDKMSNMFALELSRNPLLPKGIAKGAFEGLKSLYYLRITETGLTEIPKDLPSSISEIHLDRNKILRVDADDFKNLHSLIRLRLSSNKIRHFANVTIGHMPNLQDLHLDNNRLVAVPPGLPQHKNIMALYLNDNHVAHVKSGDFCPQYDDPTKTPYSRISLYGNPIPYWEIQPGVFRCALDWIFIQLERPN
ncbi:decorin-like [Amblyraja radiata]|uniref:decorin-like n=1 Tax=Amblyraja radiata TaxID=386614 RepID=UPI001402CC03|nr:decorin-like [Amblyraja radiata]